MHITRQKQVEEEPDKSLSVFLISPNFWAAGDNERKSHSNVDFESKGTLESFSP